MKLLKEFREFISRGNVIDLAVGMIIGSAFTAIVTSLVSDIITPLIGILTGGRDLSGLSVTVGSAALTYGNFIGAVIHFLIVAFSVFLMVKAVNRFRRKKDPPAPDRYVCPYCRTPVDPAASKCPACASPMTPEKL